jgi:2-polyprenyl-3-methyl-5-hydroxy-6-metoxy-1,4-benzoquinol methylase
MLIQYVSDRFMINTTCSVCGNTETINHPILFDINERGGGVYQLRECTKCHSYYTYFDQPVDIETYYNEKDYTVKDTKKTIFYKIQEYEYSTVLNKITKILTVSSRSLLDFGCGKGLFLQFAKKFGFNGKGIESSKPRADYATNHFGLQVSTDYYSKGKVFERKFSVITLFHVLEHLTRAEDTLRNLIEDNLEEKGLLVIEVPNLQSWQSQWAGNRWLHLDVPRHVTHFTPQSLSSVIKHSGCTILKKEYFSFHLGIIGMIQTIFVWFGYKGFLIGDIKQNKSLILYLKVGLALPFAILLEAIASAFNRGGVIRCYAEKRTL